MSLVGRVGRRRPRARFALAVIYALLCLGAVTTVYPFLLMVTTGLKGSTDQNDNRLYPQYWSDLDSRDATGKLSPGSLLGKYLDDKYAGSASAIASSRTGAWPVSAAQLRQYEDFLKTLPLDHWQAGFRTAPNQSTGRLTMRYQGWLRERFPSIEALNRAYLEENVAFQSVSPPAEQWDRRGWRSPAGQKWQDWLVFKDALPVEFRLPILNQRQWQEHLRSRYQNQMAEVPPSLRGDAKGFESIPLGKSGPEWDRFVRERLPTHLRADPVETQWTRRVGAVPMPMEAVERAYVASAATALRQEFSGRNYAFVLDYILINGRAVGNTLLFVALVILTQLIVNPLAAYALSRYPIRASGKILIFLLATMAFPAEVAMIPSFLLLKDFGLLNTFAALVLPAAASGYMIFLLKGFFDSLPAELFEAGQIDGAPESQMMMRIALPLSKPVLGYMALLAFMGAYGAFMYAFLVAQDQRMWTLMVFIYQLQLTAPKAVMMAALTLAALPTLVVFLLAQRVIMRGIVLPGER